MLLVDRGRLLLADNADTLRDSALTVSGPAERVASFARGRDVLHTETLGTFQRSVVRTEGGQDGSAARSLGLSFEPTSLQQYVVALSRRSEASPGRAVDASVPLEEVS